MPDRVRITDVSPRDGLQNEAGVIPTARKVDLIRALCFTGVDEIEITSFVSQKWVPQLGDAAEVLGEVARFPEVIGAPLLSVLIPNERGLDSLLVACQELGRAPADLIRKISVFTAASETFNVRNTNASIAQSMERFRPVIERAHAEGMLVRGYISCVIACPFEGRIAPEAVERVAVLLLDLGVDEIDLGDTIGAGTPQSTRAMLQGVIPRVASGRSPRLSLHLHDTFGNASACVQEGLAMGVRSFDASVAGLGGCPYASTPGRRAPGNIDTRKLVETIHQAGFETGVSFAALDRAAACAREIVGGA